MAELAQSNQRASSLRTPDRIEEEFIILQQRITGLCGEVIRLADAAGRDKADAVRAAAADLSDMWMALIIRGARIGPEADANKDEVGLTLTMPLRRLNVALYGEMGQGDREQTWEPGRVTRYVDNGISAPELQTGASVTVDMGPRRAWQRALAWTRRTIRR